LEDGGEDSRAHEENVYFFVV
jgi:hypothetical protein